jgi:general secretion pathway protein K
LEIKMRAPVIYQNSLRHDAFNVMYAALTELKEYGETDSSYYSYAQGWGTLCADGRAMLPKDLKIKIAVTDENAKLPLQKLTADHLEALLYEMGMPEGNLKEISNTIIDWMDSDNSALPSGAEKDDYDPESALPPNRPMRSLSELKYVKEAANYFFDENGFPNEFYSKFESAVSINSKGNVNLNNAPELVLRALFKMDAANYDENLQRALRGELGGITDGITWATSVTEISNRGVSVPAKYAGVKCELVRIDIEVSRGLGSYCITVFCDLSSGVKVTQIVEGGKD